MNRTARLLSAAALALACVHAWPQPAAESLERTRIAAERSRLEAEFTEAQKRCYQKFAVNSCIDKARARRRGAMADLRRQEVLLNDEERRKRSADHLRELEERNSTEQRQRQEERRARALADQQQREQRAADKARQSAEAASAAAQRAKPQQPRPGSTGPDVQENVRRYEERIRQAEEHRAKAEARAASKAGRQVKPLPVPP